MADIDLAGQDWEPIGYGSGYDGASNPFMGTFDGNGHVISNLTINKPTEIAKGLFGSIKNATVKNIEIRNASIVGSQNCGVISGQQVGGRIENCVASGSVTTTYTGGGRNNGFTGGVVGVMTGGTIDNCASDVDVTANSRNAGGFVGHMYSGATVSNSYYTGDVNGKNCVGGIVGFPQGANVINSYSTGNISGTSDVGGISGSNEGITIKNSYSTATVTGTGGNIGGLAGGGATIQNSYATGYSIIAPSGSFTNCYGLTVQNGVEAQDNSWFEDPSNLSFLGSAYDYSFNPPQLLSNPEPLPSPPAPEAKPEPTPVALDSVDFQIGANSGENNMLNVDLGFSLNGFAGDVTSIESASDTLNAVDEFKKTLNEKRSEIGVSRNRIDGIIESQSIKIENLSASHSTIVDTDFAKESATQVKSQILQQATSLLLKQANFIPNIALQLLQ